MEHLREIDNDNNSHDGFQNNRVKLDENEITKEQLEEKMRCQKASERIIEIKKGEFKTLHRLNG
jgi:hypothetical protein